MLGTVLEVESGKALVVLDEFDKGQRFGPMSYGRTDTPPQVGDDCVVVFLGAGISRPKLIWWSAPD
jgi:hypothetical protein